VAAVTRRPLGFSHPKLKEIKHENFLDYSALTENFKEYDACAWCLGVSQTQVSKEDLHTITYDYTLNAANAMLSANPKLIFLFQSGAGADRTEKSTVPFAVEKGKTENALIKLFAQYPKAKLYIARPAGIQPIHINKNTALVNKLIAPFYPIIKLFSPNLVITSLQLAKAMLYLIKNGSNQDTFDNQELKALSSK
jgi:hypothetical protein